MNRFFISFKLLRKNLKTIIIFEAIYKLFTTAIFTPLLVEIVEIALRLAGMNYLTNARFVEFITKPTTIAIVFLLLIMFAIFSLVEMSALSYCYHMSYNNYKATVMDMLKEGCKSSFRLLWNNNFLMVVYILVLMPITYLVGFSAFASMVKIPEFVMELLKTKKTLLSLLLIVYAIMAVFAVRWINCINYYSVEKMSFKNARKASVNMNRKNYIVLIISFVIWQLAIFAMFLTFYAGVCFGFTKIISLLFKHKMAYKISLAVAKGFYDIWLTIYFIIVVPITFAFLSGYFYARKNKMCEEMVVPVIDENKTEKKKYLKNSYIKRVLYIVVFISAVLNIIYISFDVGIFRGKTKVQLLNETAIAAHRGYSAEAPENTLPAFEQAVENLTDYVELDVQELKDGTVIVMHDSNFKRVSGFNKNVWNVNYEDIMDLDVGKWFSDEYEGTTIPTLEEVLEFSKGKLKLNIEIKLTGHEKNLEKSVVELIEKYKMEKECVVTSFQSKALKNVKKYNENIKTGYILRVAYGDFSKVDFADALSVNYSFATQSLINEAHNDGIEVYVWTVNTADSIYEMLERGVDMIITDDPVLAAETFTSYETNPYVVAMIKKFMQY